MPVQRRPPSLRAAQRHDTKLSELREEARTGLASTELRRTLIREHLRPHVPAPPPPRHGGATRASAAGGLVNSSAAAAEGLPAAWLTGDFTLGDDAEPASTPTPESAQPTAAGPSPPATAVAVTKHASYLDAARTYEALCTTAAAVVYDVGYEDSLRRVEARDERTGLATSWVARRGSAPLLGVQPALMLRLHEAAAARTEEAGRSQQEERDARHGAAAALTDLYSPPPPSRGVSSSSSSFRAVGAATPSPSLSRRGSRGSTMTHTSVTKTAAAPPPRVPTSAVGSAVMRSTAAHFAAALRQRVQSQRQTVGAPPTAAGGAAAVHSGRLSSLLDGDAHGPAGGEPAEWRTHVAAAVTLVVCERCGAMCEWDLLSSAEAADAHHSPGTDGAATGGRRTMPCRRCSADVFLEGPGGAAPPPLQEWVMAPPPPAADKPSRFASSIPVPRHTAAGGTPPQPTTATTATAGSAVSADGCGTDSVGFAEQAGEESFAALIARIRAAKKQEENKKKEEEEEKKESQTCVAARVTTASTSTSTHGDGGGGCVTSLRRATDGISPASALFTTSQETPPAVDAVAAGLRAALSLPYFFELQWGATRHAAAEHPTADA